MRSVDEQALMYQRGNAGRDTNLTLGLVINQTAYLQQLVTVEVLRRSYLGTLWTVPAQFLWTNLLTFLGLLSCLAVYLAARHFGWPAPVPPHSWADGACCSEAGRLHALLLLQLDAP